MVKTYGDLFLAARRALIVSQGENAAPYARLLLSQLSGKTQAKLIADHSDPAPEALEEQLTAALARLDAGEPLAYLLGRWSFYGMDLIVTPDVLIPRDDTMAVTDLAILHLRQLAPPQRVLDLCTGSGCIGLAVAKHAENCRVVLGDLSEDALRVCRQNARQNGLTARTTIMTVDALQPPTHFLGDFNVIVCNPPYIRSGDIPGLDVSVRDYEPLLALDGGADGLEFYRYLAEHWKLALRRQGTFLFEVGYDQAEDVSDLLAQYGYRNITQHKDYNGILRGVEATL